MVRGVMVFFFSLSLFHCIFILEPNYNINTDDLIFILHIRSMRAATW